MNLTSSKGSESKPTESDTSWHLLLVLIGLTFTSLSLDIARESPGQPGDPGPGALPFWLSVFLLGAGAIGLVQQIRHRELALPQLKLSWNPSYTFGIATLLFIIAIERIGFMTAGFIYSFWLTKYLGTSWRLSIVITVLLMTGIQLLFVWFFQVQLPTNSFGF